MWGNAYPPHAAYVYAGLYDLAESGDITLEVIFPWSGKIRQSLRNRVVLLEAERSGDIRRACIDFSDHSNEFNVGLLEQCDVYFKRDYYEPDTEPLPPDLRRKLMPFGLVYSCRSVNDTTAIRRILAHYLGEEFQVYKGRRNLTAFYAAIAHIRDHLKTPFTYQFESTPEYNVEPSVIFQTRVYAPNQTSDKTGLNEERVALIRALKRAFGRRFIGGLTPSDYAKKVYPDCISPYSSARARYIHLVKSALIGVYSRGLHFSTAWKLGEYFAASSCLVCEPIRNALPVALEAGKHYLPFTSPDECVAACAELLRHSSAAAEMRQRNHEYYISNVKPSVRLLHCLGKLFRFS